MTRTTNAHPLHGLRLDELRKRTSAKWRAYPEDVLPLWVAEMDAPTSQAVIDAVQSSLALGDTGYAFGNAYAEALASFSQDRWGWSFDPERTIKVADVITALTDLVRTLTSDGDAVIITPPIYPPFSMIPHHTGRRIVHAPLTAEDRFDLAAIEDAFREATAGDRAAVFMISNPHNPTGTVHTRAELEGVARLARQYPVRVLSDEIHAPLIMPGETFTPYLDVAGSEQDFAVISASKGWNLAAFKSALIVPGGAIDDEELLAKLDRHGAAQIGLIAQTAALNDGRDWLDALLADVDANRQQFADLLRDQLPGTVYRPPSGTYLAWVDCRELGLGDDPAAAFLERGKVAFSSGIPFGPGGEGHIRVNMATSPEILADAVQRMASVVAVPVA